MSAGRQVFHREFLSLLREKACGEGEQAEAACKIGITLSAVVLADELRQHGEVLLAQRAIETADYLTR